MIRFPVLLDSNLEEDRIINPIKLAINENIIPLSTATMTVPKDEAIPGRSYIELYNNNGFAGIYRTRTPDLEYNSSLSTITLEHAICELGDWIISQTINESVMSAPYAIQMIFSYYKGNLWQLGSVDALVNIVCNIRPTNLLQAIISIVNQLPGYMISYDFSTTPWTFSVVRCGTYVQSEGRLSRNVESARISRNDTNLCTRVYLKGLPTENPDALGYIDADTASTYGIIENILQGKDYTAEEALIVANNHLSKYKRPIYTVTINGYDLAKITGESLDSIRLGNLYRLTIPQDEIVVEETITAIKWNDVYDDPTHVNLTLSEDLEGALQFIHAQGATQSSNESLQDQRNQETQEAISQIGYDFNDRIGNLKSVTYQYPQGSTPQYTLNCEVNHLYFVISGANDTNCVGVWLIYSDNTNAYIYEVKSATAITSSISGRTVTLTKTASVATKFITLDFNL